MASPVVSFIIPVYNVAPWLKMCVESVQRQTLSQIEIILIDDGSTDESGKMCDDFALHDERIRVIHKKNEGQGVARNCGMDAAQGEYIAFIDSDDSILPRLAEDNVALARKHNAQFVVYGFQNQYTDNSGNILKIGEKFPPQLSGCVNRNEFWRSYKKVNHSFATMRIYSREFVMQNNIRFAPIKVGEDAYFLSCLSDAPFINVVFNQQIYYMYSIRPGSAMTSFQWEYFDERYEAFRDKGYEVIRHNEPEKGMYDDIISIRGIGYALEALKKLSFAKRQIPLAKRCSMIEKFCQNTQIAESLAMCKCEWIGERWKWISVVLLKKGRYRAALIYCDALQSIRQARNAGMKAKANFIKESAK